MVMHARKQPRLKDGYERKETHLHQDMQYNSLFAEDSDDDGPLNSRVNSRYQNKHSYIERNKEKRGSLSLAEKKVSHYLATGSLGRPIPMESSFTFSGEPSSGNDSHRPAPVGQRKERSGSQGERGSRDYNNYSGSTPSSSSQQTEHRIPSQQHSTDFNTHTDKTPTSTSTSNNGKQTVSSNKEHGKDKEQVQKSAIRVCGDWSEHISSSGKRYYYNCKTEVSQWEKPKEWISELCKTPDHRSKDGRPRVLSQSHANKNSARHSSSNDQQQLEHVKGYRNNSGENIPESQHCREALSNAHHFRDSSRDNGRELHKSVVDRTRSGDSMSSNLYNQHNQRSGSTPGGNNGVAELSIAEHKRSHTEGPFTSSISDYKRSGDRRHRTDSQGSQRFNDTGQGPIDDMDISPSPSPSPSSSFRSSAAGTPQLPPTSTPIASSTTSLHNPVAAGAPHRSSSPVGNPIPTLVNRQTVNEGGTYDKTIQTLQELQKALSIHIIRAQQNTTTPRLGSNKGEDVPERTSPVSATSSHSSCGSPTPSDSSSQNAAFNTQLNAAAMKREETAKLTASLSNYYNEKLIGHVLGWQADLVEKQAVKLWEESMANGNLQISQISVQLKRARSQVRIAEIQSTLHEQRILSSDHQRQEIENLKTPSSFLPS